MKTKRQKKTIMPYILTVGITLLVVATAFAIYHQTTQVHLSTKSKLAYIDGDDATYHVANFYRQYIASYDKPGFQKNIIASYGNKNLVFYNDYYQHGFNPITCSTLPATKVTTTLDSTGSIALVKARVTYADQSNATLTVRTVLSDTLDIDTITCPGEKANLPPTRV